MKDLKKEIEEAFGTEWQDEQREKMIRIQFPTSIKKIETKARLAERKKTLEEVLRLRKSRQTKALQFVGRTFIDIELIKGLLSKITKRGK